MPTSTLRIEHVEDSDPVAFTVGEGTTPITGADGRPLPDATIPAPDAMSVTKGSQRTLSGEVRWYLEKYLTYPFDPNDKRAERAMNALQEWGCNAFTALFDRDVEGGILADVVAGRTHPAIEVVSNDPRVLAWPWEALCHPTLDFLAHHARITRRLAEAPDPHPVSPDLPEDRINVLLVTARPKQEDIDYRSVSRPLVDLIEEKNLPAAVCASTRTRITSFTSTGTGASAVCRQRTGTTSFGRRPGSSSSKRRMAPGTKSPPRR